MTGQVSNATVNAKGVVVLAGGGLSALANGDTLDTGAANATGGGGVSLGAVAFTTPRGPAMAEVAPTTGSISVLTSGGSVATTGALAAANSIALGGPNTTTATIGGNVTTGNNYSVTGGSVVLGTTGPAPVSQSAKGNVVVTATTGTISSRGTLTLNADNDGSGDGMTLSGAAGIDFMPTTAGDADAALVSGLVSAPASNIAINTATNGETVALGKLSAGTLSQGAGAPGTSVNRTGDISFNTLALAAANTITTTGAIAGSIVQGGATQTYRGTALSIGASSTTAGDLNYTATTGALTVNTAAAAGTTFLTKQGATGNLSITSDVGGIFDVRSTTNIRAAGVTGTGTLLANVAGPRHW